MDCRPRFFDSYERYLLNHRMGIIDPKSGGTQYYLSLAPGAWKTFTTPSDSFWCCTGTGIEEFSKFNDSIYNHDIRTLYINLFIASELDWPERGLRLRQETNFPESPSPKFQICLRQPADLNLAFRIPEWALGAVVKVIGRAVEVTASPGSCVLLRRTRRSGDQIELELPMHLRSVCMPNDTTLQAFIYGPLVLAAELGEEGLTKELIYGHMGPPLQKLPRLETPTLEAGVDPAGRIRPVRGTSLSFTTASRAGELLLKPISAIYGRRYAVYFPIA